MFVINRLNVTRTKVELNKSTELEQWNYIPDKMNIVGMST